MTARFRSKSIANVAAAFVVTGLVCGSVSLAAQNQAPEKKSKSSEKAEKTKAPIDTKAPAQQPSAAPASAPVPASTPAPSAALPVAAGAVVPAVSTAPGIAVAPDYVIGSDDVLSVVFWRDKDLTTDVTVRPDGNISIPLINEVHAAGLTPAQLKDRIAEESRKYIEDPTVTVVVKEIKSRKVFITGEVKKPGPYSLSGGMSVLQLISVAGGLADYAKPEKISIVRNEGGRPQSFKFNYKEVLEGKKLAQNIELKPGDTVIVP